MTTPAAPASPAASHVLLVEPVRFRYNPETRATNAFQTAPSPEEQERLSAPNLKVMEAATKMFFSGQGPPPNLAGLDSLAQWSLWASREGLTDPKKFSEEYVGLVKRNYEAQNKKFDKKTKEQVENVAQQFWPYVEKVLQAAK